MDDRLSFCLVNAALTGGRGVPDGSQSDYLPLPPPPVPAAVCGRVAHCPRLLWADEGGPGIAAV
eukprot:gene47637-32578_t